jgi:excisionase family DNA binding protein
MLDSPAHLTPPSLGRLRVEEASKYLGFTVSTLNKMRMAGRGPRYLKLGNRVFYRRTDLDAYLEAMVVETTDSRARAG